MKVSSSKWVRGASFATLAAVFTALSGCSSTTAENGDDPARGFNRAMHSFNKGVDTAVVRPLSKGYEYAVPETAKHVINNEVRYLSLPVSLANSALQGNVERSGQTLARLLVNGTIGGLGALDPATEMGIPEHSEDFGQTLATWGVGSGPYLELPLLGPSTVRDALAKPVDVALNPLTYIGQGTTTAIVKASERPARIIDTRYRFGKIIDDVLYKSEDSYTTVRNTYLQRRRNAILNGKVTEDVLPDILEQEPF